MEKNKLTPWEAKANLAEMREKISPEHAEEVEKKIFEAAYEQILFDFDYFLKKEHKNEKK